MEEKLVTIVAPSYNHENFIESCIQSIANQTYKNKELIIIDDFSKDNTVKKIENIINREDIKLKFSGGIKLIQHMNNKGAHNSINEGLNMAEGEYLTIINTDDLYKENRLEVMISEMEKNKSQICFSKVDVIDDNGDILRNKEWRFYNSLQKRIDRYKIISLTLMTDNVAISTGNMLFTKSLYNKVGEFKNYKSVHDWDFILRACLEVEPIYVKETSYLYRVHNTNAFKELRKDPQLCNTEYMNVLKNFFKRIQNKQLSNSKILSIEDWKNYIYKVNNNRQLIYIWNYTKRTNFTCY